MKVIYPTKKDAIIREKKWAQDTLDRLNEYMSEPPNEREWVSPHWDPSSGIDCMPERLMTACCGHGEAKEAYVQLLDGTILTNERKG